MMYQDIKQILHQLMFRPSLLEEYTPNIFQTFLFEFEQESRLAFNY